MKYILCIILFVDLSVSCATTHSIDSQSLSSDTLIGERIYSGIVNMKHINRYPEYADFEAARSAYYDWKIEFIQKHGAAAWDDFVSRMKRLYGEPKFGYEGFLDPKTM